jgi:hypothetical protein
MIMSKTRKHAEEVFKRTQKPPVSADLAEGSSELACRTQHFKTALLKERRLARGANEKSRPDRDNKQGSVRQDESLGELHIAFIRVANPVVAIELLKSLRRQSEGFCSNYCKTLWLFSGINGF